MSGGLSAPAIKKYTQTLWDGLEGWACVAVGVGPHLVDGKYQHEDFHQHFVRWPRRRDEVVATALEAAPAHDVWICPALRIRRERRRGTGIAGSHLWADIDHDLEPKLRSLVDRLTARSGSFSVASGTAGHQHVYVKITVQPEMHQIEALNYRLARTVGGDAKWDETTLLRLPGTLNHKARAAGGAATPVTVTTAP